MLPKHTYSTSEIKSTADTTAHPPYTYCKGTGDLLDKYIVSVKRDMWWPEVGCSEGCPDGCSEGFGD